MKRDQHDPLCAWWSIQCDSDCAELPYGSSCKHMFCVCDLIANVEKRALSAQIDHYNNGWQMAIAEIIEIVDFAAHKSDCVCYCCRCIQDDILVSINILEDQYDDALFAERNGTSK